jgi:hypothetical protein
VQQQREREILEQAVHAIAQRANSASQIIDEAYAAGLPSDHPVTIQAKRLRLELLQIKGELERSLEDFSLTCTACGLDVHWVGGVGDTPGHWGHRFPAPHGEPMI